MTGAREPVLQLLRRYLAGAVDTYEREMAQRTIGFVETYPDCADRQLAVGHLTGSAWIVDPSRRSTLLTHHEKLDKWLQLGGHADGELDLLQVASREAKEESGLTHIAILNTELFDVDCHWIPPHKGVSGHFHYDLRFLFEADPAEPLVTSHESKALAWVELTRIQEFSREDSILRMARKTEDSRRRES